ncbi:MAG: hypothetical protein KF726_23205 [Anaerolineae bacterium]|nr:hypothetical protein [Anaerolineae bacterium]
MPGAIDSQQWNKRKEALDNILTLLAERTAPNANDFAGRADLHEVVLALQPFAKAHFDFFITGFTPDDANKTPLLINTIYPPEHVLRAVETRIAVDTRVIEQIIGQRTIYTADTEGGRILKKADLIAREVLSLLFPRSDSTDEKDRALTVLSYFERVSVIRVVPYANVALIGIPYSTMKVPQDFLAICHEAGHYAYWNKLNRTERNGHHDAAFGKDESTDKPRRPWLDNWVEELFADVFGAYVGGAAMALDWQDIQALTAPTELLKDDGDHPMPFVRPEIYLHVMEKQGFPSGIISALRTRWDKYMTEKGATLTPAQPLDLKKESRPIAPEPLEDSTPSTEAQPTSAAAQQSARVAPPAVTKTEALTQIKAFIDSLDEHFKVSDSLIQPLWTTKDTTPIPAAGEDDSRFQPIYEVFEDFIADNFNPDAEVVKPASDVIVGRDWEKWVQDIEKTVKGTRTNHWFDVFVAEGWTSEGPYGQPPYFP